MALVKHDIPPARWGPHAWAMFHGAALSAPDAIDEQRQAQLRAFYESFGHGLPCTECRAHYAEHLPKNPPPVGDRRALILWTIDVHNGVNRGTHKPPMTHDAALQHWTNVFGKPLLVPGFEHIAPQHDVRLAAALALLAGAAALSVGSR